MSNHGRGAAHDGSHDGLSHGHGASSTSSRKLAAVSVINLVGFVGELAGGLLFGSVALLGDAIHATTNSHSSATTTRPWSCVPTTPTERST